MQILKKYQMATTSTRFFLVLAFGLLLSLTTAAKEHLVGGKSDGWKIPSSENDNLNKWAEKTRFQIGDTLVWKYDSKKDSVLQVTREAYLGCNTSSPTATYKQDETKVVLKKSGPYYFISGTQANCDKGQKLIVVVMNDRKGSSGAVTPALAPAAAPGSETQAPAVAPTSGASVVNGGVMVVVGVVVGWFFMM